MTPQRRFTVYEFIKLQVYLNFRLMQFDESGISSEWGCHPSMITSQEQLQVGLSCYKNKKNTGKLNDCTCDHHFVIPKGSIY